MTKTRKYRIGPDVDLDEEVIVDGKGKRITEEVATEIAEDALRKARRGRPSLTGGRKHSPQISFRVPEAVAARASEVAEREGKSLSELGREALERYLERA